MLSGNESNGINSITFSLEENARHYKTMQLDYGERHCDITLTSNDDTVQKFPASYLKWAKISTPQVPPYSNTVSPVNFNKIDGLNGDYTVAGNYAWTNTNTLVVKLYWNNWIVPNTFAIFKDNGTATISNDEGYPGGKPEVIKATSHAGIARFFRFHTDDDYKFRTFTYLTENV